MDDVMSEYFVLFKPRDIVSGDFYWIKEVNHSLIVVAADCTGHGVPGAVMSMLGIALLNEQLGKSRMDSPGEILGQLRSKVKEMLVQQGNIRDQKDGMDMAIAILDKEKKELQFAGANNPLYLIRRKELFRGNATDLTVTLEGTDSLLFELKGDKQPIGVHWEEKDFSNQILQLQPGDSIYVFTDGYVDQYGGEKRKKFKTARFKELLLSVQKESMAAQKQKLEQTFENWRGSLEQIDDVCVIGVRI
jgi:serine phosphatase RsbU (regulator of sigma subunit)